ncbi:hypothetical protein HPB52_000948 [Rhipicephalus sanguineus]|uniref:Uncharacterized protein n=1 Tax=Rhipicephalus sanguineus TaxID=34632 RepID=A0A9D4PKX6_RHISA|nr:hypothetical protein HPB52_000948 [Rhipicephalus sanguineus]
MSRKRVTTIDLYMAIEMLQAAWMSATASTIANCFRHASFGVNSGGDSEDIGAAANEGAGGDQDLASWDALLDAGVVPDCDTFCTYVSPDADAVTTEELTEAEIVRAVTGGFLHAHVSYLAEGSPACLLLLTVDRDLFFPLQECRRKIAEADGASIDHSGSPTCESADDGKCFTLTPGIPPERRADQDEAVMGSATDRLNGNQLEQNSEMPSESFKNFDVERSYGRVHVYGRGKARPQQISTELRDPDPRCPGQPRLARQPQRQKSRRLQKTGPESQRPQQPDVSSGPPPPVWHRRVGGEVLALHCHAMLQPPGILHSS